MFWFCRKIKINIKNYNKNSRKNFFIRVFLYNNKNILKISVDIIKNRVKIFKIIYKKLEKKRKDKK